MRRTGFYAAAFGEPKIELTERRARVIIPSSVGPHHEVRFHGNVYLSKGELFAALDLGASASTTTFARSQVGRQAR